VITSEENISISERALELLARTADGSMRDALTLLDQVSAFSDEISEDDLMSLLGISDSAMVIDMIGAILDADRKAIISLSGQIYDKGQDSRDFIRSLISFLRDLLVSKVLGGTEGIIDIGEEDRNRAHDLLQRASEEHLTLLLDALVTAENEIRVSAFPRVALEMILLKASFLSRFRNIGELLKKLPSGDLGKEPAVQKGSQTRVRKVPEDTAPEGEACRMTPEITEGKDLWSVVLRKVDEKDHVLACKLSHASAELEGDDLTIIFNGGFSVHADAVTENKKLLEEVATESAARKIRVAVQTKKKQGEDIKEKILNDPFVRDTLELFDGRIVDIRPKNSKQR
jgi:DNA polymerase-3 subunit gamma/tau